MSRVRNHPSLTSAATRATPNKAAASGTTREMFTVAPNRATSYTFENLAEVNNVTVDKNINPNGMNTAATVHCRLSSIRYSLMSAPFTVPSFRPGAS
ncbi:MAG: hypothetical protein HW389_3881 [Bacteroidetes bacterium]|nr:hypothetical protein [Bacteroidota bacterium]